MLLTLLRAKIHGAVITQANRNYVGSITIDRDLLRLSGLLPNERVLVADIHNGARFETYILAGKAGTGVIGINGAAAHLVKPGEPIIIMAFAEFTAEEAARHEARVLILDSANKPVKNFTIASRWDA
ncbi:MAG: aspartate 1-decarboxylase [Planctomycetes bacterium]|jgi:aspartate 1-decarboxylase|nr:aspartate 1-decarboxylase [Planctomycetota bacterium]